MLNRDTIKEQQIVELYKQPGISMDRVGAHFGITRQRVHQILKRHKEDHKKEDPRTYRQRKKIEQIKQYLNEDLSRKEIAEKLEMHYTYITVLIRKIRMGHYD